MELRAGDPRGDIVGMCRDVVRNVKAHLELNLVSNVKGNKKSFSRCISKKRKTRENMGLVLNGAGDLVTKDREKVKVLNTFFLFFFFSVRPDFSNSRPLKPEGISREMKTCLHWRRIGLGSIEANWTQPRLQT